MTLKTTRRTDGSAGAGSTEPIGGRSIPHSVEAEQAVIGSILLLPEAFDEVALIVRADDFYDDANRTIFQHLADMHDGGQRVDLMLLVERLKKSAQYEEVGGPAYLAEIGRAVSTAAHAEFYAKIVADKALLRSLIHASIDMQQLAYNPTLDSREIVSKAEERLFGLIEDRNSGRVLPIGDVLQESLDRIDARMDRQHAFGGVETGFDDFDQLTGGLHKSELIVLAARPSMGKTALAMNIAEHAAMRAGVPTLFVSLEMSAIELGDRLLCSVAEVNGNRLRNGTITQDERRKLVNAAAEISRANLHIDDSPSRTMTEIAATARRLKRRDDLGLIVIDYLQLIDPDNPRDPRQEQVSKISRRLKGLARELKLPVLCLAQLNRQVESSHSNKPQLSHLRESGAIEQDADVVMFVHRDEYYQTNEEDRERVRGEADLLVRKQRNGPTGDVKLTWVHEFTRFRNFSHKPYAELETYAPADF
ncbi:MAG TPA: replicative DNA helicase [Lacipirellulaceae bacterium]|mgnify:CR=1 FL=1|nr:replicative DNA helicase [Lacipirellulaceae bacterium]HMP07148.1 replicative DNA helicase [Lacipirellulaceae bacterium]